MEGICKYALAYFHTSNTLTSTDNVMPCAQLAVSTDHQSRILAGTNLRSIISRTVYRLKHAGENNSPAESRETAGMVT